MDDFFSDMKVKDKNPEKRVKTNLSKKAKAAMANVPLPPIRNKVDVEKLKEKKRGEIFSKDEVSANSNNIKPEGEKKAETLKRDITPMFDYYKAWDKFATKEEDKPDTDLGGDEILEAKNPTAIEQKAP